MLNAQRGEIYFVDLGETKGSEVRKIRPCIIVQNDKGNLHAPTTIVIPISNRKEKGIPTQIQIKKEYLKESSSELSGLAMSEQVRTVDKCRVLSFVGKLTVEAMEAVDNTILTSMGIRRALKS